LNPGEGLCHVKTTEGLGMPQEMGSGEGPSGGETRKRKRGMKWEGAWAWDTG
jgi:hypothetical protein